MRLIRAWRPAHIGSYEQITAVIIAVVASFLIGAYAYNPIQEGERHVAAPIAREVGILPQPCPNGWDLDTAASQDARVQSCTKGAWRVWLTQDGKFDHAWNGSGPFVFNSSEVPGWK